MKDWRTDGLIDEGHSYNPHPFRSGGIIMLNTILTKTLEYMVKVLNTKAAFFKHHGNDAEQHCNSA